MEYPKPGTVTPEYSTQRHAVCYMALLTNTTDDNVYKWLEANNIPHKYDKYAKGYYLITPQIIQEYVNQNPSTGEMKDIRENPWSDNEWYVTENQAPEAGTI